MTAIKIGVFLPNWVGDVVMSTPTLRALRTHFGGRARLIGIMRPYVADVLAGTNWLDDKIFYDRGAANPELGFRSVVEQLRDHHVDQAILTTNSLRSAWLAVRAKIPQRIGYVRYGRAPLLTRRLYPPRSGWRLSPISAVDYYLELAKAVGAHEIRRRVELSTIPSEEQQADRLWRRLRIRDNETVIVLNGGAAYGSAKQWPVEHFAELAQRLAQSLSVQVVVLCGPAERHAARRVVQLATHPAVHSLADERLSLGLSKAVIRRSDLLISTDSGPRHIGAAFDVPTVTLFGPTDPRWSHNYNPRALDLQHYVPCGPCARRECPLSHHRCMTDLTVDQAFRAALHLLRQTSTQRVA